MSLLVRLIGIAAVLYGAALVHPGLGFIAAGTLAFITGHVMSGHVGKCD